MNMNPAINAMVAEGNEGKPPIALTAQALIIHGGTILNLATSQALSLGQAAEGLADIADALQEIVDSLKSMAEEARELAKTRAA